MELIIGPKPSCAGNYALLNKQRDAHAEYYAKLIAQDPRISGRVLDAGAGAVCPTATWYPIVYDKFGSLDGVDPDPGVLSNTRLINKWNSTLEKADVPAGAYDAAISVNVVEHVFDPTAFLTAIHRALKPGGVYYSQTPHGRHPFSWTVRALQATRLKKTIGATVGEFNEYPAVYLLNTISTVRHHAQAAGFARAEVHLHPCVNWDRYFPTALRFVPNAYDFLIGVRSRPFWQQLMFKLEKAK